MAPAPGSGHQGQAPPEGSSWEAGWVSCQWLGATPTLTPSVLSSVRGLVLSATGDVGTGETAATVIVIPPGNRSVVAGSSEITLECIANAR